MTSPQTDPNAEFQDRINELKLKRVLNLNKRLTADLQRERITASNACLLIIDYTHTQPDYLVQDVWGELPLGQNPYRQSLEARGTSHTGPCCVIV